MASIIQLNGKWRAQVRRTGTKPQTKTFNTKGEAERWAKNIEKGIEQPKEAPSLTIAKVIEEYRALRKKGHASKVFEVYAKPDPSYLHNLPQPPSRKPST